MHIVWTVYCHLLCLEQDESGVVDNTSLHLAKWRAIRVPAHSPTEQTASLSELQRVLAWQSKQEIEWLRLSSFLVGEKKTMTITHMTSNGKNIMSKSSNPACINMLIRSFKNHCHPVGPMNLSFVSYLCNELSSFRSIPWDNICIG